MTKITLDGDFSDVPLSKRRPRGKQADVYTSKLPVKPARADVLKQLEVDADGYMTRLLERHVSLVDTYKQGIPAVEELPGSAGAIYRGKRHHEAGPAKAGKSFGALVLLADMALAGCRVLVLDRENGRSVYAERLEIIVKARGWSTAQERVLRENLLYLEFPVFSRQDRSGDVLVELANALAADLIVFDSQRWFLTDMGLSEDSSDDYSTFVMATVDKVFRAKIAVLVLDNTGHEDKTRGRGSSSKLDLYDHLYTLKKSKVYDRDKQGHVTLTTLDSRIGRYPSFMLALGGGHVGQWRRTDVTHVDLRSGVRRVMEAEGQQVDVGKATLSYKRLRDELRKAGVKFDNSKVRKDLDALVVDDHFPLGHNKSGYLWDA